MDDRLNWLAFFWKVSKGVYSPDDGTLGLAQCVFRMRNVARRNAEYARKKGGWV